MDLGMRGFGGGILALKEELSFFGKLAFKQVVELRVQCSSSPLSVKPWVASSSSAS